MKEIDPKIQRIISWREDFATLPDNHFYELIRMYLGEIHTPYNKPKLIEELGAFLRKEENRRTLVSLLNESDIQIISAVWYIPGATQEKIAAFFSGTFSFAVLYERLLNLEERLILYRHADRKSGKVKLCVNPMLEETLAPYISMAALLPEPWMASLEDTNPSAVSPELLAAFIAFTRANPDMCKNDGSFKKRAVTQIESLFPGRASLIQVLATAFINLSLLKETAQGFAPDIERLKAFAELDENAQYAYICVASQGRFSRSALVRQAQLLMDCISSLADRRLSRTSLLRLSFLVAERDNDIPGVAPVGQQSRFAALLARAQNNDDSFHSGDAVSVIDRLIDNAVLLGLLAKAGQDESGETVYARGSGISEMRRSPVQPLPKVLSIDAGFSVTLLPGLPLRALIPLMQFMELRQFDTAATFEITKKSAMRAFDGSMTQVQLEQALSEFCMYELPQNLLVSIEDWYSTYTSAALYKGYVLHVSAENSVAIERNRVLSSYIAHVIAPGTYLLSVQSDEEAAALIEKSGLDFIGSIKSSARPAETPSFPAVRLQKPAFVDPGVALSEPVPDKAAGENHLEQMKASLEELPLTPEQKDGLLDRIQRKIILTPLQLRGDSVRLERIEASGMDFSGKIHIIDNAMSSNSMVELEYENPGDADGDAVVIVGNPLGIEKLDGDALVRIEVVPQHEEKLFSIGRARLVKRIRGSVLR